jgi:hypothetical protein
MDSPSGAPKRRTEIQSNGIDLRLGEPFGQTITEEASNLVMGDLA